MSTLIIGGGAAGLMAACFSTGKTVLIDRLSAPGRKLLTTGGGRCNLTHDTDADDIAAAFGPRAARFPLPALRAFPPDQIRAFFRALGVDTRADADGCVFPVPEKKASDVLDALLRAARDNGAEIRCGVRATGLILEPDPSGDASARRLVGAMTTQGALQASRVILAAGGQSYPELGSDGSGFQLAREAGLTLVRPVPALAGLLTAEAWPVTLAGIVCDRGGMRLEDSRRLIPGPVLFTHRGVSGPPALALSGEIAARLHQAEGGPHPAPSSVTVRVSFRADRTASDWLALFSGWRAAHGGRALHNLLSGELPRALAVTLCGLAGAGETAAARAGKVTLQALASACADLPLHVTATEGWHRAMLTRGGVALDELNPKTLACRRTRNLFCAGEIVDLDAPCGGFNLTWAFASGRLAAVSQP